MATKSKKAEEAVEKAKAVTAEAAVKVKAVADEAAKKGEAAVKATKRTVKKAADTAAEKLQRATHWQTSRNWLCMSMRPREWFITL